MKQTRIYSMMLAVLITAMSVGLASCNKDEKELISSEPIMGRWYILFKGQLDPRYYFELKTDGTYAFASEIEAYNGTYKIIETEKITFSNIMNPFNGVDFSFRPEETWDATLFTMEVSKDDAYNQLRVYHYYPAQSGEACLIVGFSTYYGTFQQLRVFRKTVP